MKSKGSLVRSTHPRRLPKVNVNIIFPSTYVSQVMPLQVFGQDSLFSMPPILATCIVNLIFRSLITLTLLYG